MHLPVTLKEFLLREFDIRASIKSVAAGGGCINDCFELSSEGRKFFLKRNDRKKYPGMFEAESKGLELLRQHSSFKVPKPLFNFAEGSEQYLLLEFLEKGSSVSFSHDAGIALAKQHRQSEPFFGLDHDNYIGSIKQSNKKHRSFQDFFVCERVEPLLKTAVDERHFDRSVLKHFANFTNALPDLVPNDKSALLHGDLWSGNIMSSTEGPSIYDPAVYYGHRETDIAMTKLFGGFDNEFYRAYESDFPLEKGWQNRTEIFNLYPLMVHVLLFGGGYIEQVKSFIRKF